MINYTFILCAARKILVLHYLDRIKFESVADRAEVNYTWPFQGRQGSTELMIYRTGLSIAYLLGSHKAMQHTTSDTNG
jgi:hypothetical protein